MEKTWKVVLAFVGIFIAGTVTGSLITLRVANTLLPQRPQPGVVVEQFGMVQMQRLAMRLELSETQKEKIKPIVQKSAEDIRRLSRDSQVETRDIIARMNDQVSALLTPEQQRKFGEMQRRMNQEFLNRGNRGGPGGPGPMGGRPQGPQGQGGFRPQRNVQPGGGGALQPQFQPQPQPQSPPPPQQQPSGDTK